MSTKTKDKTKGKLTGQYLQFVQWEAMPDDDEDKTEFSLVEYAAKINVSPVTLSRWRAKSGHWDRVKNCYEKHTGRLVLNARKSLYKLTQGVLVQGSKYTRNAAGELVHVVYLKPPDVKAIDLMLESETAFKHKLEVNGQLDVNVTKADKCAVMFEKAQKLLKEKVKPVESSGSGAKK